MKDLEQIAVTAGEVEDRHVLPAKGMGEHLVRVVAQVVGQAHECCGRRSGVT